LQCNKVAINLHQQTYQTMTNTMIAQKTGFRAVYLHAPHDGKAFEQQGNVIWETYLQAIANANSVCEDLSTPTWSITVKYIIAIPLVGQVEVEHLNHIEL
jgi:hypothetical protein